jgi:hypothetical protein
MADLVDKAQELRNKFTRDVVKLEVTVRVSDGGSPPTFTRTRITADWTPSVSDFEITIEDI